MKSKNNLNRALKDALSEYQAPLNDSQWERISKAVQPKKKFWLMPWFYIIIAATIVIGVAAYNSYDFKSDDLTSINNASESHQDATFNSSTDRSDTDNRSIDKKEQNSLGNFNINRSKDSNKGHINKAEDFKQDGNSKTVLIKDGKEAQQNINNGNSKIRVGDYAASNQIGRPNLEDEQYNIANESGNDSIRINEAIENKQFLSLINVWSVFNFNGDEYKVCKVKSTTPMYNCKFDKVNREQVAKTDGLKLRKSKGGAISTGRFTFGFGANISRMNSKVSGLMNQEKLHMDTKSIFEMANRHQTGFGFQFGVDYQLNKRIGLVISSGIQYKAIYNNVNFNYRLVAYPIRDSAGLSYSIDTGNAPIFRIREFQSMSLMMLPIKLGYNIPLGTRHELIVGGGVLLGSIIGSSGRTFMVNDIKMTTVSDILRSKYSIGYTASLGYSYNIGERWWAGLESNLQTLNMEYNLNYGSLKARLVSLGLGVNLRYKL